MGLGLNHTLVIERATSGAEGEYGQPSRTYTTLSTVKGLVQPKTAEEVARQSQAGVVVATHTIYVLPTDVVEADRVRLGTRDFEITGVRDAGGAGHHLELDAREVLSGV